MSRAGVIAAALGGSALLGYAWYRRHHAAELVRLVEGSTVIPIITPVIEIPTAEYVLSRVERLSGDDVTVVIHTEGGNVTACVMIADALRQFARSTAIVPYMAISGGTLIALNARTLKMGRNAALSAVDPVILGQRARHIPKKDADGVYPLAQEYGTAISGFLRDTLRLRLAGREGLLDRAMQVFMGDLAPHSWPIKASEIQSLGLEVEPATSEWARFVDTYRYAFCRRDRD